MRPHIELSHLKYFYFSVLEGGVNPAADRLGVQQPVVSKMVKSLEGQFGKALFKKTGRRNTLTDFGQLVYRHCQTIFAEVNKVEELELKPEQITGTLGIAAADPIAGYLLPSRLARLNDQFPSVHFNVYTSMAIHLLDLISGGNLDIGFFFHVPTLPNNLEIIKKIPTRFHLVIHSKSKNDLRVIQSFIGSREIDNLSNHKFPTVERLRKKYPETKITMSSNHLGLHRQMVLKGKGVSILPDFLVGEDLKRKTLVDLFPKENFIFDLKVIARKGQGKHQLSEALLHSF